MLYNDQNNYPWGFVGFPSTGDRLVESGLSPLHNVTITSPTRVDYTSEDLIVARIGGLVNVLIPTTDDAGDGNLDNTILDNVIQNVSTEIDGYLGTIYPIPYCRRDTVALVRVKTVSSVGAVTAIEMVTNHLGYYALAPSTSNSPVYAYPHQTCWSQESSWPWHPQSPCWSQNGTGLALSVTFTSSTAPFSVVGTPTIGSAGTGYVVGDIVALVGGASYVPNKVQNAALDMVCKDLYTRRLAIDEQNIFAKAADAWREELKKIGCGDGELDALFPRLYTPGSAWVTQSRLNSNSL